MVFFSFFIQLNSKSTKKIVNDSFVSNFSCNRQTRTHEVFGEGSDRKYKTNKNTDFKRKQILVKSTNSQNFRAKICASMDMIV